MASSPSDPGSGQDRLRRCIRDLAAINALPSLCIGRTPEEALDILIDALPTALGCDLVYFALPGDATQQRASLDRVTPPAPQLDEIRAATAPDSDGSTATLFVGGRRLSCIEAEVPMGAQRGRLLAGKYDQLDPETDRVLIRTAANQIGTIIETANVLEAARRKDEFLAMLGHELRNPLAPIVTAVELMKVTGAASREREVIERHTHHMVRIVDDLLDISRVTRGHIVLQREQVALTSVLQRATEIVAPLISRHKHELSVEDAKDITLEGDPIRLAQVFGNLLTNAAKFTPPGGRISVLVQDVAERVRVTVQDTGRGIEPDQLRRIFEPFVQADRTGDSLRGGLGLGLAIVKNLVEQHRGTIVAHSEGRGRGAAFMVELPVTSIARARPLGPAPQPSEARARIRVLVVDDNPDIAYLLSEALESQGFQTAVANDGQEALASWQTFLPHAGVLDVGLPDVSGYDLAQTIRSQYGANAVLIAVTGYGQPTDRLRSSNAGFDCHFVKPVSLAELVKILDLRVVPRSS